LKIRAYGVRRCGAPVRDVCQRFAGKRSKILKSIRKGDARAYYCRPELNQRLSSRHRLVGSIVVNRRLAGCEKGVRKVGQGRARKVVRQLNVIWIRENKIVVSICCICAEA